MGSCAAALEKLWFRRNRIRHFKMAGYLFLRRIAPALKTNCSVTSGIQHCISRLILLQIMGFIIQFYNSEYL